MKLRVLLLPVILILAAAGNLQAMGSTDSAMGRIKAFHPVITLEKGEVTVKGSESEGWEQASVGMLLFSGDTVVTGKASQAEIQFASGAVRIYENSSIVIPSIGENSRLKDVREIFIDNGAGTFKINPQGTKGGFEFRTKTVQGSVRGTVFTVTVKKNRTMVAVFSGMVEVSDSEGTPGSSVTLEKGQAIIASDSEGLGEVKSIDTLDAWKDWENDSTPDTKILDQISTDTVDGNDKTIKGTKDHGAGIGANKK